MSRAIRKGFTFLRACAREGCRDRCQHSFGVLSPVREAVAGPIASASTSQHATAPYSRLAVHQLPKSNSVSEPAASPQVTLSTVPSGSRLYKIASVGLVDIPEQLVSVHQNRRNIDHIAMLESSNRLVVDLNQARMPEAWRKHRFYIKPKERRHIHKWKGIVKRKRKDFNYRLRWALKSMSRYVSCNDLWGCAKRATVVCTRSNGMHPSQRSALDACRGL